MKKAELVSALHLGGIHVEPLRIPPGLAMQIVMLHFDFDLLLFPLTSPKNLL